MHHKVDPGRNLVDIHEDAFPPEHLCQSIMQPTGSGGRVFSAVIDKDHIGPLRPKKASQSYRGTAKFTMGLFHTLVGEAIFRESQLTSSVSGTDAKPCLSMRLSDFRCAATISRRRNSRVRSVAGRLRLPGFRNS